jgi:hypothetical protein
MKPIIQTLILILITALVMWLFPQQRRIGKNDTHNLKEEIQDGSLDSSR